MMKKILPILLLCFVSVFGWGATVYCDLDDGGEGDGSIGDPWATLTEMRNECSTGDVINIKGSETLGAATWYWDGGKNVTWQEWSGFTATITVTMDGVGIYVQVGILTIDGIGFTTTGERDPASPVIEIDVGGSSVRNCTFTNWDGVGIYLKGASSTIIIDGNTFTGGLGGHAIWVNDDGHTISNNTVTGVTGGADCIFIQEAGDDTLVFGNDLAAGSLKSDIIVRGGTTSHLSGVRIYNNYFHGANTVSGIDIDASNSSEYEIQDLRVYNNVFLNTLSGTGLDTYGVIRINDPWARTSGSPIRIYNNSISLKGSDTSGEVFKAGINLSFIEGTDYIIFSNNIVRVEDTDANGYAYAWRINGTTTNVSEDYGYYYSTEAQILDGTFTWGGNTTTGTDPDYTNDSSDLSLQSSSGCINNGVDLSTYFTIGISSEATWPNPVTVARPQSIAWDIGAYEYDIDTYYVDYVSGLDTNNGTSESTPWKRCPGDSNYTGGGSLSSGDTVYFKLGVTYLGQITTQSDTVTYTILSTWGTGDATIDGSGNGGCLVVHHSYITVYGGIGSNLRFTGTTVDHAAIWAWGTTANMTNLDCSYLKFENIGSATSAEGIGIKVTCDGAVYHAQDYEIDHCIFDTNYDYGIKCSGQNNHDADIHHNEFINCGVAGSMYLAINISSGEGNGCQDIHFRDNEIRDGTSGIGCNEPNNYIYDNDIHDLTGRGMILDVSYGGVGNTGFLSVYRNKVYDNDAHGISIGNSDATHYTKFYNNLIYNNATSFGEQVHTIDNQSTYNEFYNNTFYSLGGSTLVYLATGCTNNTFKNNIMYGASYTINSVPSSITENYNCCYTTGTYTIRWNGTAYSDLATYRTASGQGAQSTWSAPTFVNAPTDLSLQASSVGINDGDDLSAEGYTTDYDGITRPQGAAWDIGAYEFDSEGVYYVDFDSGDNSNHGMTLAYAWKECPGTSDPTDTPTDGWGIIGKGETVIFTAGQTWNRPIRINATNFATPTQESERITLKSSSTTTRAIFDFTGLDGIYGYILSPELPYISFEYLELCNITNDGTTLGIRDSTLTAHYGKLLYCYIHDIIDSVGRVSYGIVSNGSSNLEWAYNVIMGAEAKLCSMDAPSNCIIHHNLLYITAGYAGDGIDHGATIAGTGNSFYNNVLWTDKTPATAPSYAFKFDGHSDGSNCDNNKAYNNLILGWPAGMAIMDTENGGNVIANNTIYLKDTAGAGTTAASLNGICLRPDGATVCKNNIIRNNIVYYVKVNTSAGTGSCQMYLADASVNVANNTITNNLFYHTGSNELFRVGVTTNRTLAWVETSPNWNGLNGNVAENNVIANPGFSGGNHLVTNLPTGFNAGWSPNDTGLTLASGSDAKDIGYTLGSPYNIDINGLSRPQGTYYDAGAYEAYVGSAAESKNVASWKYLGLIPGYSETILGLCIASVIMNIILLFLMYAAYKKIAENRKRIKFFESADNLSAWQEVNKYLAGGK